MTENYTRLLNRIAALENEHAVRDTMQTYMRLCDDIGEDFPLSSLMSLFTEDAVWEGVGEYYQNKLGRHEGKTAIEAMFAKYTLPPSHFKFNLHILANEFITVKDSFTALGSWILIQPSDFTHGKSHLSVANIKAEFANIEGEWKISLFQTRNMFSKPMNSPWQADTNLPVPS